MKLFLAAAFLTVSPLSCILAWDPLGQALEGIGVNDNIGTSAAISKHGTRVVIGSPLAQDEEGVARVYKLKNGSWSQVGSDIDGGLITNLYGETKVRLGTSVDISGDGKRIVISAPGIAFSNTVGYVGVWNLKNGEWTLGVLMNSTDNDNFFGSSVAMCNTGSFLIIGSPVSDASTGRAYLYQEDPDTTWSSTTLLGTTLNGMTGSAVNFSGDCSRVIVNGRTFDPSSVNADWYSTTGVYNVNSHPYAPSLTMIGEIVNTAFYVNDDSFVTGSSVDLTNDGNRAIVGNTSNMGGYAQVYDFDPSNSQWNKKGGEMVGWELADKFGYRVGICGDGSRLIVGSPVYGQYTNGCEQGRSQVFEYVPGNSGIGYWQSIVDFDGNCDRAGNSVGISDDCKIVITGYPKHASSDSAFMEVGRVRAFVDNDTSLTKAPSESPSIPPVSSCGPCYEHSTTKFFYKFSNGKAKYKNCKWLSNKSDQQIQQICNNLTLSHNGYGPPSDVCPKTCGVCV